MGVELTFRRLYVYYRALQTVPSGNADSHLLETSESNRLRERFASDLGFLVVTSLIHEDIIHFLACGRTAIEELYHLMDSHDSEEGLQKALKKLVKHLPHNRPYNQPDTWRWSQPAADPVPTSLFQ